ncbi:GPI biosynthesis protein family Pig-F-domain-containing protein [Trametes polyzona]|nr:GPI biosynthesis protein family Pig-F-domain-containing protein [Trametes polyzona]
MPARKAKAHAAGSTATRNQPDPSGDMDAFFPFARYTSIVGVHTSLLAFSTLLLPTTPTALLSKGLSALTAGDRPRRDVVDVLTENPARTVAWICGGTLILQGWWASWMKTWAQESRTQASGQGGGQSASAEATQRKLERKERGSQRVPELGKAAAMTLAASAAFHVIVVLFGAPLVRHLLHTYLMSLLLAILTVFPPAYTLGLPALGSDSPSIVSWFTWVRLFAELSPRTPIERALVYPAVGALMGCWAGAIPIGLDWERPWQAWPLTPVFGAVGGYIVGSLVALVTSATLAIAQVDRQAQQQAQSSTPTPTAKTKKS